MDAQAGPAGNADQLTGWKEIAAYLGKSVRTVQRWERQAGLPVHRVQPLGEVVFAFRSEMDAWRSTPIASADEETPDLAELPVDATPIGGAGGADSQGIPPLADEQATIENVVRPPRGGRVAGVAFAALLLLAVVGVALLKTAGEHAITVTVFPLGPQVQGQHFNVAVQGATPGAMLQRWTRVPSGQEEPMSAPIQADAAGDVQWGFSTDCHTETGTHHLWIHDEVADARSASTTLVVVGNPACEKALPDLAVRVDRVDRSSISPGDTIIVSFTIWNMGTAVAVATRTRLRLGRQSTRTGPGDATLLDVTTPALAVGNSSSQDVTVVVPRSMASGVYYVWIVADNGSATIEPNSFNNFARSQTLVVTSRPEP